MADTKVGVGPGFLLLAAFLYYVGGGAAAAAFFTAALAHELGHLAAMAAVGARVTSVRLTASGPVIRYAGELTARQELAVVAAGPVAGLLFAVICFLADTPYYYYAGLIAALAAAFNLLPALPLDGGRLAYLLLECYVSKKTAAIFLRVSGSLCGAAVAGTGIYLRSWSACAMGIWLAVLANCPKLR